MRLPAERMNATDIQQLARGAIGFGLIPDDLAAITDNALDQLCQFTDGDVFTDTDIDVLLFIVVTQEMEGGISDVIDMEKLAPWYACGM